jgi:hypothetical protein
MGTATTPQSLACGLQVKACHQQCPIGRPFDPWVVKPSLWLGARVVGVAYGPTPLPTQACGPQQSLHGNLLREGRQDHQATQLEGDCALGVQLVCVCKHARLPPTQQALERKTEYVTVCSKWD